MAKYTAAHVLAPVEIEVVNALIRDSQEKRPVVALFLPLKIDAPAEELERLAAPRLERARRIFSWISSGEITAFASVIATSETTSFRPIPPPQSDRQMLFGLGGTKSDYQASINRIANKLVEDERFAFALSLYHDALRESDQRFRIARMFNVLESLANDIKTKEIPSRKAVRQLLGLSGGATMEAVVEGQKYRFDCIEVAGRLRDRLFHGSDFSLSDLNADTRSVFALLTSHPEIVANAMAGYCELALARKANNYVPPP